MGDPAAAAGGAQAAPLGLYIHIPFCAKKCPYCDFNTYAGLQSLHGRTVDALCQEMAGWRAALAGRTVATVFLGGGTPTVLSGDQLEQLFGAIHDCFHLAGDCEVTSEANPGTVDRDKFVTLRRLGVNRLSIGVQSFQPEELRFLGRVHDVADVYAAFADARRAGFDNINLDFMFGLPQQAEASWLDTLEQAVALAPEHLSLYSLIVEPDTPLQRWVDAGTVPAPDEDQAGALYERAMERLAGAGYVQYEVSNWARHRAAEPPAGGQTAAETVMPSFACRHNLIYWRNQEYLGIGPGAHSHLQADGGVARRWGNLKPVPAYVRRVVAGQSLVDGEEVIAPRLAQGETMMLGLRLLREGVPYDRFQARHGVPLRQVFAREVQQLAGQGLVEIGPTRIHLTPRGLMIGNQVFARFLPDAPVDA